MLRIDTRKIWWLTIPVAALLAAEIPAAAPAEEKMVEYSFSKDLQTPGLKPWRLLQRLQSHLRKLDPANDLLSQGGCVTNFTTPSLTCADVAEATGDNQPEGVSTINSLFFTFYEDKQIDDIFKQAFDKVQEETSDSAFKMTVAAVDDVPPPACIPPYKSPCVSWPPCTQYGGCSRKAGSCQQCSYP